MFTFQIIGEHTQREEKDNILPAFPPPKIRYRIFLFSPSLHVSPKISHVQFPKSFLSPSQVLSFLPGRNLPLLAARANYSSSIVGCASVTSATHRRRKGETEDSRERVCRAFRRYTFGCSSGTRALVSLTVIESRDVISAAR